MPRNKDKNKHLAQGSNAHKAYSYYIKKGYSPHASAGIVGNLMQESGAGLNTGAVGDGGDSFGVAQWNKSRKVALQKYAKKSGRDVTDLYTQLDFLDMELSTKYKKVQNKLHNSATIEDATMVFSNDFEVPHPDYARNDKRRGNARQVFEQFSDLPLTDFSQPHPQQQQRGGQPQQGGQQQYGIAPTEIYSRDYWRAHEHSMNQGFRPQAELPFMSNTSNPYETIGADPRNLNTFMQQYGQMADLELKQNQEQEQLVADNKIAANIQQKKNERDFIMEVANENLVDIVDYDYGDK